MVGIPVPLPTSETTVLIFSISFNMYGVCINLDLDDELDRERLRLVSSEFEICSVSLSSRLIALVWSDWAISFSPMPSCAGRSSILRRTCLSQQAGPRLQNPPSNSGQSPASVSG